MITQIDHIGIAVKDLEETMKFYTECLGLKVTDIETVRRTKSKNSFYSHR